MGRIIDLAGLTFGKLTVVSLEKELSKIKKQAYWKCRCECGNYTIVIASELKRGGIQSCGCSHKEAAIKKINDLTGLKFGRWTVLSLESESKNIKGRAHWLCRCECGKEKIVSGRNLLSGDSSSCGCLRKEMSALPFGESNFNALYYHYNGAAKRRNLEFALDKEYFKFLTKQDCYYCGKPPAQVAKSRTRNGEYIYNGVDRIDSTKGYIEGNVVPCCGRCNEAKMAESQEGFIEWVKITYLNLKEKGIIKE